MRALALSLLPLGLGLLACDRSPPAPAPDPSGGARPVAASAAAPSTSPSTTSVASVAPTVAPSFDPARAAVVLPPATLACSLSRTAAGTPAGRDLELRAAFGDAPFAYLASGPFELQIPVGASNGVVSATRAGFELRGLFGDSGKSGPGLAPAVPASPPVLRAAKPIMLGGVFQPAPATLLSFAGATPGKLAPTTREGVVVSKGAFEPHDCADFSLDVASFTLPPRPTGSLAKGQLLAAGTTGVAATAEGAPIVDVIAPGAGLPVTTIEESSGRSRIVLDRPEGRVIGWVDATRLSAAADAGVPLGDLGGLGHAGGRGLADPSVVEHVCDRDVPLYVDVTEGRGAAAASVPFAAVGTIRKGTKIPALSGGPLARLYGVRLEGIWLAPHAWLAVARADLAGCSGARR